jgi:hypothetical protein
MVRLKSGGTNFSCIFYYFVNRGIFTNYFRIDPFMGEKEGLEAIDADAAYNNGQGLHYEC